MFLCFFITLTVSVNHAQTPQIISSTQYPLETASKSIVYGNGVYLSVLATNRIYRSTDGSNWSRVISAPVIPGQYENATFGAGAFVLVGTNGFISSSTDGISWTTRSSGTTQNLRYISFLNGNFYATGFNRTLLRSPDGINWTAISINVGNATDILGTMDYGGGIFAIAARNGGGSSPSYIYYSTTGNSGSWSLYSGFPSTYSINNLQYLKDRFYAFFIEPQIYTSGNASSWSLAAMTQTLPDGSTVSIGAASGNQIYSGLYDGVNFHFYGFNYYFPGGFYSGRWQSANGTNLTLHHMGSYNQVGYRPLYANGNYFLAGSELSRSVDGNFYSYPTGSYKSVASNGSGYVGVGTVESNQGVIFSSTDFSTWVNRTPLVQKPLSGIIFDGSKYVAVGNSTVTQSTNNGVDWTEIATPAYNFTSIVYAASRYIATGADNTNGEGKLLQSSDAVNWTVSNNDNNNYIRVKHVNGYTFAMGFSNSTYEGVIYQSADGVSWANITPALSFTTGYFNDVVFDGTKYHFTGVDGNYEFFSVSTANFSDPASFGNRGSINGFSNLGGYSGEGAFAYTNGYFVGAVNNPDAPFDTYVIYSQDGVSWTATPINESTMIGGVIVENNRVRMLGTNDGKITVNLNEAAMPVTFGSISATLKKGILKVLWQSEAESNNKEYTIEASVDGQYFSKLGTVNSLALNGNSHTPISYSFEMNWTGALNVFAGLGIVSLLCLAHNRRDRLSLICSILLIGLTVLIACNKNRDSFKDATGKIYIRIQQVDIDGKKTYSKVVQVVQEM
ncbi:hypothetical protein GCM10027516_38330 [Niabella aquatica]